MTALLEAFHFLRPGALALLPVTWFVWWFWRRAADPLRGWREQVEPDLLRSMTAGDASERADGLGLAVAWSLAAAAIAGPTWEPEPSPFADDSSALVILLKADVSMDIPDPQPSRLERAQLLVADLAAARAGQPLGLIAYAGSAHLVLPPTRDTDVVPQMAAEISPTIMPEPGDRLDLALVEAARILGDQAGGGSVVVLADSVDVDPARLSASGDMDVQFVALAPPGTAAETSVREAGRLMGASVVPLDLVGGEDTAAVVRGAAGTPIARTGDGSTRWQEAGYGLVPLIALLVLLGFRREESAGGAP